MVQTRLTATWAALVVLTLASFAVASLHEAGVGFVLVMLAAAIKGRLVVREYMELRHASGGWRLVFEVLVLLTVVLVGGMHLAAKLVQR